MKKYTIAIPNRKPIECYGDSLEDAVKRWGKEHPKARVSCGLLVRVKDWGNKGVWGYWSGEKFMECLG